MKKVVIFGGSGFIGRHLVKELEKDYNVIVISRHPKTNDSMFGDNVKVERLRSRDITKLISFFEGAKAIINLSGENVGGRWTNRKMEAIKNSRLDTDNIIIRAARSVKIIPSVFIQGSAIGIYGFSRRNEDITEESPIGQRGFLPKVAISHEETFKQLEKLSRVVYVRTGLVLDANEGALQKMAAPYKMYLGGKLGNGKQWNSWIHIQDEVRAIRFLIENTDSSGPYNLTAPNPIQQNEMATKIGKSLDRPSFIAKPSFLLQIFLGNMANELLVNGLKVLPQRLLNEGFKFNYETIDDAFDNIYGNS
jgi:uncharacterized protein (TIGR01777 family)